ncbi:MAG: DUF4184 family protein [bacterium]|nr:DUF4184 family protein [bacterium]
MPFTPYHLGPGAAIALSLPRRFDIPVLISAGLVVDLEVPIIALIKSEHYIPRYGHTLLVSAGVGLVWALLLIPFHGFLGRLTRVLRLPYEFGLVKTLLSGVVGAWSHVLVDGLYRTDAGVFWPSNMRNPLCRFGREDAELFCLLSLATAAGLYVVIAWRARKEVG